MTTYTYLDINTARKYGEDTFVMRGFSRQESADIMDVLITADLYGIESHGIQRLIRYHQAIDEGSILPGVKPEIVFETAISAVIKAPNSIGQVVAKASMNLAIDKAKKTGFAAVVVRESNHFGIAGYYASMAADSDMMGLCMTNTEAIAVPTFGKKAMLGTNPIAVCMPADPVNFWYDAATTVVTRGKLEVFSKKKIPLPHGWASDENGQDCTNAQKVLNNIIGKLGGGIFPIGGCDENTGSHKGYGLGIIVELFTSIFAGGTSSPQVENSGNGDTSFCFLVIDYGIFGDKKEIKQRVSVLLQELRDSPKAKGHTRIYSHGEKEVESKNDKLKTGIPVNDKTLAELKIIGDRCGLTFTDYWLNQSLIF